VPCPFDIVFSSAEGGREGADGDGANEKATGGFVALQAASDTGEICSVRGDRSFVRSFKVCSLLFLLRDTSSRVVLSFLGYLVPGVLDVF